MLTTELPQIFANEQSALKHHEIKTVADLAKTDPVHLEAILGWDFDECYKLVNNAAMMSSIKGLQSSNLVVLTKLGVNSVADLYRETPVLLHQAIIDNRGSLRKLPSLNAVRDWISQAGVV